MAKVFREWSIEQRWLLPPSVLELVPADHLAHFVRELVREELDLSAIFASYTEERGQPPFHPAMMTALLLYSYCQGVYSSRRIARACEERVDFMAVTAMNRPDFRTVAKFRVRHLEALGGLFKQVLRMCQRAGLVSLGHVALDGTKVNANASKHKAMSYGRMPEAERKLAEEVERWLAEANATDAREDREHGDRRGDELPEWVANKQKRLAKIREAKAALEAEAREKAAAESKKGGGGGSGTGDGAEDPKPEKKAQRNFTDPDSRIMHTRGGFVQAYNAQLAVDSAHQIIVAQSLNAVQSDSGELPQIVAQIRENTGRNPDELSADNGYFSGENIRVLKRRRIRGYIAPGRERHANGDRSKAHTRYTLPLHREMAARVRRGGHRSRYRLRKSTVEPVNGHIKECRGFRRFSLRGAKKVRGEWSIVCTVHNLLKLARSRG